MSASSQVEVELKYAVPEGLERPPLTGAPGLAAVEAQPVAHLAAVYFDTAERTLLAARIALRRRTGGHDAGWHVKLPGDAGRLELHAPIDPAAPDALPAELERALRSRLRGRPIEPIARIDTERRGVVVTGDDGGRVEVVDDAVAATDVAAGASRSWREWEAERLGDGAAADAALAAVDAALLAAGATRSASPAKLAQALGGLPAAPSPEPRDAGGRLVAMTAPLAEALHAGLTALVVSGDPDGARVHGLRKTLRRLRSLLALDRVAGPAGAALRDRLGALGAALGEARDPLVAAGLADGLLRALPDGAPGAAEARAALVDEPGRDAGRRTERAVATLLADEALAAYAALDRFLADGPDGPAAHEDGRVLVRLGRRALRRARRRAAHADAADLDSLHRARKAAKRARMVAEELAAAGLIGRSGRRAKAGRAAKAVQEALGDHRDLALLLDALPAASARVAAAGGNAYALGLLAERGAARLHRLARRADRRMRALRR